MIPNIHYRQGSNYNVLYQAAATYLTYLDTIHPVDETFDLLRGAVGLYDRLKLLDSLSRGINPARLIAQGKIHDNLHTSLAALAKTQCIEGYEEDRRYVIDVEYLRQFQPDPNRFKLITMEAIEVLQKLSPNTQIFTAKELEEILRSDPVFALRVNRAVAMQSIEFMRQHSLALDYPMSNLFSISLTERGESMTEAFQVLNGVLTGGELRTLALHGVGKIVEHYDVYGAEAAKRRKKKQANVE